MGEIADYMIEQMMEYEYYEDMMNDYISSHTNEEIVKDAREWITSDDYKDEKDEKMVWGILAYYLGYQKLSYKQKRSLAYRILFL